MPDLTVSNNEAQERYQIDLDGLVAFIQYRRHARG